MFTSTLVLICMTSVLPFVAPHGRLWTPPGRATMWRKGFNTPSNVNDNQLYCGGLHHQIAQGYKCGLCGDPYDSNRPHEAGGKYATGTIAATYTQGQEVVLVVELTANHKGWFEFKVCPTNDYKTKATQACLDLYPLELSDGSGTKLDVSNLGSRLISIPVRLPKDLTCDLCMLQWRYHAGNNWGNSYQEEFYGCADIKITPSGSNPGSNTKTKTKSPATVKMTTGKPTPTVAKKIPSQTETPKPKPEAQTTKRPSTSLPKIHQNKKVNTHFECKAKMAVPGLTSWCNVNCNRGSCSNIHCDCKKVAVAP